MECVDVFLKSDETALRRCCAFGGSVQLSFACMRRERAASSVVLQFINVMFFNRRESPEQLL